MTVRTGRPERLAFVAVVALLLGGCATPYTHLAWNVRHEPLNKSSHTATYEQSSHPSQKTAVPTPHPRPAWYQDTTKPAQDDSDDFLSGTPGPAASSGSVRFAWPVTGRVIEPFGSVASGERNDGINIAASYGEPIRASADGIVTYTGNDLRNYGNLALIKHQGSYVTAYAHAERFVVSRGDHVAKGQVIGYAGTTGDVATPQLHFEIRRGVQPVNPKPLLGPLQVASW
jgi:murein DD-endopeptidase MepM/ murein hydrolase activator NlpD